VERTDLSDELTFASELADLAAAITVPAFGGRLAVELKADRTPVTEADRAAERAIRGAVAEAFPDDDVLGEEDGRSGSGRSGRTWVVDPIDGTRNFADGVPLWTTLIALSVEGRPVVGVADLPPLARRYVAARGLGATMNGRPVSVSGVGTLAEAVVLHSPVEDWIGGAGPDLEALRRVAAGSLRTRGISDAVGHLLVADGSAEALLEHEPCGEWDWAACMVIVEEAGGRLTALDGSAPRHGSDLLVSNGRVHDALLEAVRGPA
jgi:histidinol-phosphatase